MKVAYTISGLGHAAILLWSVWTLAAKPLPPTQEALPVDIISTSEFNQMTKGHKDARKLEAVKPLAETVAEPKPVEEITAKVDKKEVKAAREPSPEPKPVEPKPETKQAETKSDPIAEALAKEPAKKPETKKAEVKPPTPPKKPAPPARKLEDQVRELLDKRDKTRVATAGAAINEQPSLGLANGTAAQLSQYEFAAFKKRLGECWTPPAGVDRTTNLSIIMRVQFKRDGSVAGHPQIVSGAVSALGPPLAESAKRAILSCQPFKMLNPERYEEWQDIELDFNPQEMFRG